MYFPNQPGRIATAFAAFSLLATAENLVLQRTGRVTVELLGSAATNSNTLSLITVTRPDTKPIGIWLSGCEVLPASNLSGIPLISEKNAQKGCRVTLDGNKDTSAQVEALEVGTVLEFAMCVRAPGAVACNDVWSSDPRKNGDRFDHVRATDPNPPPFHGYVTQLNWEDIPGGGDQDFDDLIVVVRVERDTDGDGLWDDWEEFGVDTDGDGKVDLDLPAAGAHPLRKDVFVQVDYLGCSNSNANCAGGHDHRPSDAVIQDVIDAFAKAPVQNADGSTGIRLHVDVKNAIPHQDVVVFGKDFADLKKNHFGESNPRRFAYRYCIFAHRKDAPDNTSSGVAELPGDDLMVSLGAWTGGTGTREQQAGTFMHELGHTLGLGHGGGDGDNHKPNYVSVMNYFYQTVGVPLWHETYKIDPVRRIDGVEGGRIVRSWDYSREKLPDLDETQLVEDKPVVAQTELSRVLRPCGLACLAWDIVRPVYTFYCPAAKDPQSVPLTQLGMDWDCNNRRYDIRIAADLNGDKDQTTLKGYDDWSNLVYAFQADKLRYPGVYVEPHLQELSVEQAHRIETETVHVPVARIAQVSGAVLTREVQLDGSASVDPDGGELTYEWRNVGRPAALMNANQAVAIVQFGSGQGEYQFELTVRTKRGAEATAQMTVSYAGR